MVVSLKHIIFVFVGLLCVTPIISAPYALLFGLGFALLNWVPKHINLQAIIKRLLAISVVGLGFGMNAYSALAASKANLPALLVLILLTMVCGIVVMRALKLHPETAVLVSSGTAICGGSAIAALAPAIKAKQERIGIALACVFILNALALWLFPWLGHYFGLTEHQFGIWAALAIHDTASVVAAAGQFGDQALAVATPLKLTRALAIVPLVLVVSWWWQRRNPAAETAKRAAVPGFILLYLVAMTIATLLPQGRDIYSVIYDLAKLLLVGCVFLIGATLNKRNLKQMGLKPFLFACLLWAVISIVSLLYVMAWA